MKPLDPKYLDLLARLVDSVKQPNHGFIIFMFPLGDEPERHVGYVSNCDRGDCVKAIHEWLDAKTEMN